MEVWSSLQVDFFPAGTFVVALHDWRLRKTRLFSDFCLWSPHLSSETLDTSYCLFKTPKTFQYPVFRQFPYCCPTTKLGFSFLNGSFAFLSRFINLWWYDLSRSCVWYLWTSLHVFLVQHLSQFVFAHILYWHPTFHSSSSKYD